MSHNVCGIIRIGAAFISYKQYEEMSVALNSSPSRVSLERPKQDLDKNLWSVLRVEMTVVIT